MNRWHVVLRLSFCVVVALSTICTWAQVPENTYQDLHWRMIGPFRGGRTRAAAGVPSQPNVFYMGQVNGGVWKSDDYGRTWNPIFDHEPTQSIGAIAVAPSDPNIVYVASGEGLHRPDLSVGNGIYKSTDAGKTWTHLGLPTASRFPRWPSIRAIRIDFSPQCSAILMDRTTSAGSIARPMAARTGNESCRRTKTPAALTLRSTRRIPMCFMPRCGKCAKARGRTATNSMAAGGGLFKSTDGGSTWHQLDQRLAEGPVANLRGDRAQRFASPLCNSVDCLGKTERLSLR